MLVDDVEDFFLVASVVDWWWETKIRKSIKIRILIKEMNKF